MLKEDLNVSASGETNENMGENTASHPLPPEGVVSNSALAEQKTNETHQATKMARGGAVLCRATPSLGKRRAYQ